MDFLMAGPSNSVVAREKRGSALSPRGAQPAQREQRHALPLDRLAQARALAGLLARGVLPHKPLADGRAAGLRVAASAAFAGRLGAVRKEARWPAREPSTATASSWIPQRRPNRLNVRGARSDEVSAWSEDVSAKHSEISDTRR